MSWPRKLVLVAIVCLSVGAFVSPALATNWGGPKNAPPYGCNNDPDLSQCITENYLQGVFVESSVDADLHEEITWSMANYTSVTEVDFYVATSCSNCDVRVRAINYGANGWWASTACEFNGAPTVFGGSESPRPGDRWCRSQILRYNLYYRASKYPTDANERSVTCHEFGHTIGLRHANGGAGGSDWANSCMKDPNQTKTTTTTHDRNHVNAQYP